MMIPVSALFEIAPPATVSHCVAAVMKKGHKGTDAWNICRASLTRNGYIKKPYKKNAPMSKMKMTAKGSRRNMKHAMEKGAPGKLRAFDNAAKKMDPRITR